MKILFLDDNEERHRIFMRSNIGHVVYPVWTADEAIAVLSSRVGFDDGPFDVASLDHDLSFEAQSGMRPQGEKTGLDVARFIASMPPDLRPLRVIVHSFNPAGAAAMIDVLRDAGVLVERRMFGFASAVG